MSGRRRGSGNASGEAVFDRTVKEAVRQSKMLAQHDVTYVPPTDDASSIIAGQMFGRSAGGSSGGGRTLTFDTHLQNGGLTFDGTADVTLTTDATDANVASTIMARDASGDFTAATAHVNGVVVAGSGNVTANGGTVHGLHVTGGDVTSTSDITANGGTVHGLHLTGGDLGITSGATVGSLTSNSNVTAPSGTGTFLHLSTGDLTSSGNISASGATGTFLHLIAGDLRINIAPTANVFSSTHTIPININGTTYLLLLHS